MRTVLYSTTYLSDNRLHYRFIGKAILVSHRDGDSNERRRTGYLSASNYQPLSGNDVPNLFRVKQPGTAIYIPGFNLREQGRPGWASESIKTAVDNFFHAIVHGNLIVHIGEKEVNASNISELYTTQVYGQTAAKTAHFIKVSQSEPVCRKDFQGIGSVALRIWVHDDPKSKAREIALVRDSGMLITDNTRSMGLRLTGISPSWRGFTVIIECKSEQGQSSCIRDSESPKHDRLSVDYIQDPQRKRQARAALQELGSWVRQQLEECAGPPETPTDDVLDEFAHYLGVPDESKEGDPDKPASVVITALQQANNPGGGAGLFTGDSGARRRNRNRREGQNGGGGSESGGRDGGQGNTGNIGKQRRARVSRVRVRPAGGGATHSLVVTFNNPGEGVRNVELVSVGEDGAESRLNISEARANGEPVDLSNGIISILPKQEGERYRLDIRTIEPIGGKTFRLVNNNQENNKEHQ